MNRREFTKFSAIALAGSYLPKNLDTSANKPVGYAPVGLGTISDILMRACANSQTAKITALVTGHPDTKGAKHSAMYRIPKTSIYTYEMFDRIRDNQDIDAIYVGLPNSMHAEYTLRGAQAGKHVLCEKPMAISSAECRKMIDACRQAKVKLMIGYRVQFEPLWFRVGESTGSCGVQHFRCRRHASRRTVATLLVANGEDVKTVQESLRHANSKVTLDLYAQAVTPAKRKAQSKIVGMLIPSENNAGQGINTAQNRLSNPRRKCGSANLLKEMVARDGIEPPTPAFSGLRSTN